MSDPKRDTQQLNQTVHMSATESGPSRRNRTRTRGSIIPPLWSILLMLLTVIGVSTGVVLLIFSIGGNTPPPVEPSVVVMTAPPEPTATSVPLITQATQPPANPNGSIPVPDFVLEGPTLPPVFLSPTPDSISIGRTVLVINVGENGLNVRSAPGITNQLLFTANQGSLLEIIGGPETTRDDGFTWWQVRDVFSNQEGWAVQLYMDVQPETTTP
jgi:hypothetical protein